MTTVLTLGGLNYGLVDRLDTALRGYVSAAGRKRIQVDYPQAANARSIPAGVIALDEDMRTLVRAGQPFELVCFSQGAQVWSEWARQRADRPDAPPVSLLQRVILLGNPQRRYGGSLGLGFDWKRLQPTPETQYPTLDIARAGDPWANADCWPNKPTLRDLLRTAWNRLPFVGDHTDHTDYDDVDIAACKVRATSGNTKYLWHE